MPNQNPPSPFNPIPMHDCTNGSTVNYTRDPLAQNITMQIVVPDPCKYAKNEQTQREGKRKTKKKKRNDSKSNMDIVRRETLPVPERAVRCKAEGTSKQKRNTRMKRRSDWSKRREFARCVPLCFCLIPLMRMIEGLRAEHPVQLAQRSHIFACKTHFLIGDVPGSVAGPVIQAPRACA